MSVRRHVNGFVAAMFRVTRCSSPRWRYWYWSAVVVGLCDESLATDTPSDDAHKHDSLQEHKKQMSLNHLQSGFIHKLNKKYPRTFRNIFLGKQHFSKTFSLAIHPGIYNDHKARACQLYRKMSTCKYKLNTLDLNKKIGCHRKCGIYECLPATSL